MLRLIILTHGGAEALASRLIDIDGVEVSAIIVETPNKPERSVVTRIRRSLKYEGFNATLRKMLDRSGGERSLEQIAEQQNGLEMFAARKGIPFHRVDDFHSESSIELIESLTPDLGVIYGTNIIKEHVFGIPRLGSINLHQGLAPLYRGGPTVFWELFNGEAEVGITVHFVVSKVDAGDIIVQRALPLSYDFEVYGLEYENFLQDFRRSLKEPSVKLIGEAVERIANGTVEVIKQDLNVGKRYRLPVKREKDELRRILRQRWRALEKGKGRELRDRI
jgi:folate-dependent phosphoribosylglycinamide formyltransferase PurN